MTVTPSDDSTVSAPPPCELALHNEAVQRCVASLGGKERGMFVCIIMAETSKKDGDTLNIVELGFVPIAHAEDRERCPEHVKSFLKSIPSLRAWMRSYEVKKEFILAAALMLPNGESGCQAGKFPYHSAPTKLGWSQKLPLTL
jgi:hypothetical protein